MSGDNAFFGEHSPLFVIRPHAVGHDGLAGAQEAKAAIHIEVIRRFRMKLSHPFNLILVFR